MYREINLEIETEKNMDTKHGCSEEGDDQFYSDKNIQYLEKITCDIKEGKAHFKEHDLIEED